MGLSKQAIDSIVKLSAKERLDYSIKTISGIETLYLLNGKDDWICLQDDEGKEYLMIFPESEFAELALQWNPQALRIDEMELENFLEDTVPLMSENNIRLAIFPIDEKTETIILDPIEFAKMINDYFYEWYGEEFDLPNLSMVLHQKAINAILNLSSQERCEHTLKRIADSGVLYVLADEEGDWILWGDEKNSSLAIWPELEFARIMANSEDKNSDIYEIEIEEFLEDGIPWLIENNIGIAVFPIPDNPETIDMKAIQFAASVNKILDESYDEALDLPYL